MTQQNCNFAEKMSVFCCFHFHFLKKRKNLRLLAGIFWTFVFYKLAEGFPDGTPLRGHQDRLIFGPDVESSRFCCPAGALKIL